MKIQHLSGLIAAPFTPMNKDGKLNLSLIPGYYQFLKNNKKNAQQLRSQFFPIFRAKNKKYIFDVKR